MHAYNFFLKFIVEIIEFDSLVVDFLYQRLLIGYPMLLTKIYNWGEEAAKSNTTRWLQYIQFHSEKNK